MTYIAGSRDDFFPFDYDRATDPELLEVIWRELAAPPAESVDHRRAPRLAGPSFEADLTLLCARLRAGRVKQCVVVDLTRPEHGVPVVKVLIPGRATDVHRMG